MHELDVRVIPSPAKHPTIFARLTELRAGETLRIVNDHDPRPLRFQLEAEHPGSFTWTYVESGPLTWRVDIGKTGEFVETQKLDLLADSQALSVSRLVLKAGEFCDISHPTGTTSLIVTDGGGELQISGRRHAIRTGTVELICPGEQCTILATVDLRAYLAMAKEQM